MRRRPDIEGFGERDLMALGALALAVAGLAGALLWAGYGDSIFLERIFTAIANCF